MHRFTLAGRRLTGLSGALRFLLPLAAVAVDPRTSTAQAQASGGGQHDATGTVGPLARLAAMRVTAPANWKCLPTPALRATHRVDALVCDAHFVAASIRAAATSGQLTTVSTPCAFRVAEGVERAAGHAAAGDTIGARAAEATLCDGRVLLRDSIAFAPDILLRACPGAVWSWTDRGAAECRGEGASVRGQATELAAASTVVRAADPGRQRARDEALARLAQATSLYTEGAYDKAERLAMDVARKAERDTTRLGRGGGDVAGYALATAGGAAALQGRYEEGVERLRKGLVLAPSNAWAATQLAQTLVLLGRNAEAADAARDALALDGTSAVAHRTMGVALARLGRTDAALDEFSFAIGLAPRDIGARIERARALNAIGRHAQAAEAARDALTLRADDAFAYEELGRALAGSGDRPGAVDALRRAIALEPGAHSARERLDSLMRSAPTASRP